MSRNNSLQFSEGTSVRPEVADESSVLSYVIKFGMFVQFSVWIISIGCRSATIGTLTKICRTSGLVPSFEL